MGPKNTLKWVKMTHFRVFLDPFLDHFLLLQRVTRRVVSKKGSKKWFPGVSRTPRDPQKSDILTQKTRKKTQKNGKNRT